MEAVIGAIASMLRLDFQHFPDGGILSLQKLPIYFGIRTFRRTLPQAQNRPDKKVYDAIID
jgi:hypothetical protein